MVASICVTLYYLLTESRINFIQVIFTLRKLRRISSARFLGSVVNEVATVELSANEGTRVIKKESKKALSD